MTIFVTQENSLNLLLQVWSIPSKQLLYTCQGPAQVFQDVTWSPNGDYLAASFSAEATNTDSGIQVWDASNGHALYRSPISGEGLTWAPDSRFLLFHNAVALDERCQPSIHGTACSAQHFRSQLFRLG